MLSSSSENCVCFNSGVLTFVGAEAAKPTLGTTSIFEKAPHSQLSFAAIVKEGTPPTFQASSGFKVRSNTKNASHTSTVHYISVSGLNNNKTFKISKQND